jgi:hypothetical protein
VASQVAAPDVIHCCSGVGGTQKNIVGLNILITIREIKTTIISK